MTVTATVDGIPLSVEECTITLDESWSPYAQGQLIIATPIAATRELLDPRKGKRVLVTFRQTFDTGSDFVPTLAYYTSLFGGQRIGSIAKQITPQTLGGLTARADLGLTTDKRSPVTRTFNLGIRERRVAYRGGRLELRLASDEAILNTVSLVSNDPYTASRNDLRFIVQRTIDKSNTPTNDLTGLANARVPADAHTWLPGVFAWDFLTPLLQQSGLRLWNDEKQRWHLDLAGKITNDVVTLSYLDTITDPFETVSLDKLYFDAVVVTYKWRDAANVDHTEYDLAQQTDKPKSVLNLTYETVYPGPGAAARVLNRAQGRGREYEIEAVSDFNVTPGFQARIDLESAPIQSGVVSAVSWSFPADRMRVTTRDLTDTPLTAWLFAPVGLAWEELPEGLSWQEYDGELDWTEIYT
jgi:hypothetical protein